MLASLPGDQDHIKPYEVIKVFRQGQSKFVRLRILLRRTKVEPRVAAGPNKLVYTDRKTIVKAGNIIGRYYIRFFPTIDEISVPYNRNGTGNFFIITHKLEHGAHG
jgi:DNA (cytosine-5)-methyltransferase 1